MSTGLPQGHFDKVLLVAEIARLESLLDFERVAKDRAIKNMQEMGKALKRHSQRTFTAMNFPLDKVPTLVQQLRPWIPQDKVDWFDAVASTPQFVQGLGIAMRAMMAEVFSGGQASAGDQAEEVGPDAAPGTD